MFSQEFALQGGEDGLQQRGVTALSYGPQRGMTSRSGASLSDDLRRVLAAMSGLMDEPWLRPSLPDRHVECRQDHFEAQLGLH